MLYGPNCFKRWMRRQPEVFVVRVFRRERPRPDEERIKAWQHEERGWLSRDQSAQNRPRQGSIGFAAPLERQRRGHHGEERGQRRHRHRPHPDRRGLANGFGGRQSFVPPQLLGKIGHQHGVGHLDANDEDDPQQRLDIECRAGEVKHRQDAGQGQRDRSTLQSAARSRSGREPPSGSTSTGPPGRGRRPDCETYLASANIRRVSSSLPPGRNLWSWRTGLIWTPDAAAARHAELRQQPAHVVGDVPQVPAVNSHRQVDRRLQRSYGALQRARWSG